MAKTENPILEKTSFVMTQNLNNAVQELNGGDSAPNPPAALEQPDSERSELLEHEPAELVSEGEENSSSQAGKGGGLLVRTLSAIVMLAVAAAAFYAGGIFFSALVGLASLGMGAEFVSMAHKRGYNPSLSLVEIGIGAVGLPVVVSAANYPWLGIAVLCWCFMIVSFDCILFPKAHGSSMADSAVCCLGILYCGFIPFQLVHLRNVSIYLAAFVAAVCIITDVGAYFCGKAFGKAKLAPLVSPGKTWAGFWGALIFSVLMSAAWSYWGAPSEAVGLNWKFWCVSGLFLSLMAQFGDLFESSLKRDAGVKDSGNIIPGHGGLLDRFDSYIFATMAMMFIYVFALNVPAICNYFTL